MQFRTLFTVKIFHPYYSEVCKDFDFIVPTDNAQLLKNGKLLAKVVEGKLYVLYESDETGQASVPLIGKTLRIGLKLLNPLFSNFTVLDFDFDTLRPLYSNSTTPPILDAAKAITLVGKMFSHNLKIKTRPVTLILKNFKGEVLQTDTITENNDRQSIAYDLIEKDSGLYSVEESNAGNKETTNFYSDLELLRQGIFGLIELAIAESFYTTPLNTPPPEFVIKFAAKQETLKYYVVAKNYSETDLNQLNISDAGEEGRSQIISFTKVLPAAFSSKDIPPTLLGNGEAQIVLFKSPEKAVARQEKARQKIQLKKNGDVLIPHLPQPSASKGNADLIVQLSKPKP